MKKSLIKNPLFWILFAGFVLRFSGIGEGLPALYNSTEHTISKYALKMAAVRSLDPGIYIYPSLIQYVIAFLYGLAYVVGYLFGIYQDKFDFAVQYLVDPSSLFLIGRLFSVLISSVTILIIYRVTAKKGYHSNGLIAAGLSAVSYYFLIFSHLGIHESLLIFFTVLAIWKMFDCLEKGQNWDFILGGVFTGLAIASKYNAGFLSLGVFYVALRSKNVTDIDVIRRLALTACGLAGGFLAGNPYLLWIPRKYFSGVQVISEQMYAGISAEHGIPFLWELWQILSHEWLIGFGFLVSLFYFINKRNPFLLISLVVIAPTFIYVGTWAKKGIDYLIVCWPFLIILCAQMLGDLYRRNPRLTFYLLAVLFVSSSFNAAHQTLLKILPDTRSEASDWILHNMKRNEKICYDKNGYDLKLIDINRYQTQTAHSEFLANEIKERLHAYAGIPRNVRLVASYEINADLLADSVAFDFKSQSAALKWKTLAQIIDEGTVWFISDHSFREIYINFHSQVPKYLAERIQEMDEFYKDLNKNYAPAIQFNPSFLRSGPVLSIYNLKIKKTAESSE